MNNNEKVFNQPNNNELASKINFESNETENLDKQIDIENEKLNSNMEEVKRSLEEVGGVAGLKATMENMSPDKLNKIKDKTNSVYEKLDRDVALSNTVLGGAVAAATLGFLALVEMRGGVDTKSLAELVKSDFWAKAIGVGAEALTFVGGVYSLGVSVLGIRDLIKNRIKLAESK